MADAPGAAGSRAIGRDIVTAIRAYLSQLRPLSDQSRHALMYAADALERDLNLQERLARKEIANG